MTKDDFHFKQYMDVLRRFFPAKEVMYILEMGAKDCADTLRFHREFPYAHIYTFECNQDTLPICRKAVAGNDHITLTESAVSDTDGTLTFYPIDAAKTVTPYKDGNPGASSLFKASGKYPLEQYAQKEVRVPSTRLDTFMDKHALPGIDILWLDTQGAELKILHGLGKKLRNVRSIITEVEFMEIYSGQPLFREIRSFLEAHGFVMVSVYKNQYFGDAIFVNKDVARPLGLWRRIMKVRYGIFRDKVRLKFKL